MKIWWWLLCLLPAIGLFAIATIARPSFSVCSTNDMPADERAAVEQTAMRFVQSVQAMDIASLRAVSSARTPVSVEQVSRLNGMLRTPAAVSAATVDRVVLERTLGFQRFGDLAPCGDVHVALSERGETAVALLTGETRVGPRGIDVWMERDRGVWRVLGAWTGLTGMGAWTADTLWQMANTQRARGHQLNAAMLYRVAVQTWPQAPFYRRDGFARLQSDAIRVVAPAWLSGRPPIAWTHGIDAFSLLDIAYNVEPGDRITLRLVQRLGAWNGEQDAAARNHSLIRDFDNAYPEWRDVASALEAVVPMPDGAHVYQSVFDPAANGGLGQTRDESVLVRTPPAPTASSIPS